MATSAPNDRAFARATWPPRLHVSTSSSPPSTSSSPFVPPLLLQRRWPLSRLLFSTPLSPQSLSLHLSFLFSPFTPRSHLLIVASDSSVKGGENEPEVAWWWWWGWRGPPYRPSLFTSLATSAAIHQNFPPAPPSGSSPSTLLQSIHSSLSIHQGVLSIHHSSRQPLGPLVPDRQPPRYLTAVGSKTQGRRSMRRDKLSP